MYERIFNALITSFNSIFGEFRFNDRHNFSKVLSLTMFSRLIDVLRENNPLQLMPGHLIRNLRGPLNSNDGTVNINGSVEFLKYFTTNDDSIEQHRYAIKRIVRGLGASTCSSKSIFFRTLVGILTLPASESVSVDEIIQVMEKELKIGKEIKNKEDSDALIGHILLCGSLIRSNRLESGSDEDLSKCTHLLTTASRHKIVHSSLAFTFLIELLNRLPQKRFQSLVWPIVSKELKRPWERQNINTVHFLLALHAKYPELLDVEYLESSLQTPEILTPLSFKHLGRMFWGNKSMNAVTHPAYDELSQFLCQSNSKQLVKFWCGEVNECLAAPSKLKEIVTIKILKDLFNCGKFKTKTLLKLLTDRFVKMIVSSLKNVKQMKKGSYLVYYYDEFFEAVNKHLSKEEDDDEKVEMIKKFILHPGALTIGKFTSQNFVHQMITHLGCRGVVNMTKIYQSIFIGELAKDPGDATVQWLNVEKQHAAQMMQFLIGSKTKMPDLNNQQKMLLPVVEFCNGILSMKKRDKYLREPLTSEAIQSWKKMFDYVTSPPNKMDQKLDSIFRVMFMFMGLQLFREPETAQLAIVDLEKCMENVNKKKVNARRSKNVDEHEQPQWIEVIVDIFLHLLSQNTKFSKFVVNTLFSHLCPSLTLTAVNQILSVLDMSIANPLSTANDQLRNALSTVLGIDGDTDSVDLDDMTEEEAARLDKGLSAVFQSMKKSNPNKKSKKERTIATTVMHFRIRVLDLVEIYVNVKSPPSMEICLEIMLALFGMVELCVETEQKQLSERIDKVLTKLLAVRHFENVENVNEDHLHKILDALIQRKVNPAAIETYNKLLSKSLTFIVSNLHLAAQQNGSVVSAITNYATQFLNTRNPTMSFTLLKDIFHLRWIGIWLIGVAMAEHGFDSTKQRPRPLRRMQLFELLGQLYKNHGFIKQNAELIKKRSRKIVGSVVKYLNFMQEMNKVYPKEFLALTALLCEIRKCAQNADIPKLNETIEWKEVAEKVQNIRRKVVLLSLDSYQTFCQLNNVQVLKKSDVVERNVETINENDDHSAKENINEKKKRKRQKSLENAENVKANKKQKKLSKAERLRIASEGLNGISFSSVLVDDVEMASNASDSEDVEE
ncbi:Myb-binding protein 1A, partial [Pseudolycoriella hygida]